LLCFVRDKEVVGVFVLRFFTCAASQGPDVARSQRTAPSLTPSLSIGNNHSGTHDWQRRWLRHRHAVDGRNTYRTIRAAR
jgi:hypothetical protein